MKILYKSFIEIKQIIKEENKRVICIGTGQIFKKYSEQLIPYIDLIADNNKQGEKTVYDRFTINIIKPQDIREIEGISNYVVIIMTAYYRAIIEKMNEEGDGDYTCYIPYDILGFNVNKSVTKDEWRKKRIVASNQAMVDLLAEIYEISDLQKESAHNKLLKAEQEEKLILPKLCFLATTRCTLKCKGCIGLIDKMVNQEDFPIEIIQRDIDCILKSVDAIITAEIGGGEPFLYGEFNDLLRYMISRDKIHTIIIPTNATIIPDEEQIGLLRHEKVSVHVSDYGDIVQIAKLITLFEKNNIKFSFMADQKWIDPGNDLNPRKKTKEQLSVEYQNCNAGAVCKTVFDGRIYHCARAARCYLLLNDEQLIRQDSLYLSSDSDIREKIEDFFLSEFCYACDYCDLSSIGAPRIDAGIQSNMKRRSRYTLCKRT